VYVYENYFSESFKFNISFFIDRLGSEFWNQTLTIGGEDGLQLVYNYLFNSGNVKLTF
jgi:hypothetical protein